MPAYNAARTIEETVRAIPEGYYDEIVVVDDHSRDDTVERARALNLKAIRHPHNVGYGGNQKTCYMEALRDGAAIVVMLHPDGQYDPAIIPEMIRPIREGRADMVLGSRMLVPGAAKRGGHAAVEARRQPLPDHDSRTSPWAASSPSATPATAPTAGASSRPCRSCATRTASSSTPRSSSRPCTSACRSSRCPVASRYFDDASSVGFRQGVVYGLGTLWTAARFLLHRAGLVHSDKFRA